MYKRFNSELFCAETQLLNIEYKKNKKIGIRVQFSKIAIGRLCDLTENISKHLNLLQQFETFC